MNEFPFRHERGWVGAFTRKQAPGAIENGTPIVKVAIEEGDSNPVGTKGTVLGSYSHANVEHGALFYFVEWETKPRAAVGVIGWKIQRDTQQEKSNDEAA